jgi:hypothetical protein
MSIESFFFYDDSVWKLKIVDPNNENEKQNNILTRVVVRGGFE